MSLDATHDCWHGPYSAFHNWRNKLAEVANLPPLELMEGYFERGGVTSDPILMIKGFKRESSFAEQIYEFLPIKWDILKPDILYVLLTHSDCDGEINWEQCGPLADRLEELSRLIEDDYYKEKTEQFIQGLREAYRSKENVEFR